MPARASSRALRALVAEMAGLGDDDLQAILGDLDGGSRARLVELIDAFRRGDGPDVPTAGAPSGIRVSDWLADRLRGHGAPGVTPHAAKVLRRVAADCGWVDATAPAAPAAGRRPSLLDRLGLRP